MLRVCSQARRFDAAPRAVALRRLSDALTVPTPASKQKSDVSEVVMEPVEKSAVSRFTGAPMEQMDKRTLKIYQQAPTVVGGVQNTLSWKVQWEDSYTQRWINPLMGWTSTNDPLSNTHMTMDFMTKEDAVKFAQSNGWSYVVAETSHVNRKLTAAGPIKYADNFRWKGGYPSPDHYARLTATRPLPPNSPTPAPTSFSHLHPAPRPPPSPLTPPPLPHLRPRPHPHCRPSQRPAAPFCPSPLAGPKGRAFPDLYIPPPPPK